MAIFEGNTSLTRAEAVLKGAGQPPLQAAQRAVRWLCKSALPLWSARGFDSAANLFHERLNFDASPIPNIDRRLMVQARQISTFSRAKLDGLFDFSASALEALSQVEKLYWRRDGKPGWIFSIDHKLAPSDTKRDLYAHAFILFALAWAYRLTGDPHYAAVARESADELESLFFTNASLYSDQLPADEGHWHQNPHMHLLEAYLVLYEFTGNQVYIDRSEVIVNLVLRYFVLPGTGYLLEIINKDKSPKAENGRNRVEPGHLFEWSWLLREYLRVAGETADRGRIEQVADSLFNTGVRHGFNPELKTIYDAISDSGEIIESTTRIWPQTEFIRALLAIRSAGGSDVDAVCSSHIVSFLDKYVPSELNGGWFDRLNSLDKPAVDHMPASSLYHIYGAIACGL